MARNQTVVRKEGVSIFVDAMVQSSQEVKETKPQTRFDNVEEKDIEKAMANIKKGIYRR